MPRSVRDAKLDSRAAREKLRPRGKPYWRALDHGLHLGYRRLKGTSGRWTIRYYLGDQSYETETIATADDLSAPNGVDVLDWQQAQEESRRRRDVRVRAAAGKGPFTVADAIKLYLDAHEAEGRRTTDTEARARAMILPALGSVPISKLTTEMLRNWLAELAAAPPRVRTGRGEKQRFKTADDNGDPHEAVRRRRSTGNRYFGLLRAALTHAWRERRVESDEAWRRVKPFRDVSAARVRYLSVAESVRLINACEGEFRRLVQAALMAGARYGELARIKVADFNASVGTVHIGRSKTGRARHIVLTEEGAAFFQEVCAGRRGDEILLLQPNGKPWGRSSQIVPIAKACRRAGIAATNFHALRHTYASLAVMNGAPLHVVGKNLGHADTRMVEKHYGHLAPSYIADEIRKAAPRFGFEPNKKVAVLR